jgi:hypothetical protein
MHDLAAVSLERNLPRQPPPDEYLLLVTALRVRALLGGAHPTARSLVMYQWLLVGVMPIEIDDPPNGAACDHDVAMAVVVIHHEHRMARHVAPDFDLPHVIVEVFLSTAVSVVEPAVCHPEDIGCLVLTQ